jgi:iron complex transport system ATP-binding protein
MTQTIKLVAKDLLVGWGDKPVAELGRAAVSTGEIVVIAGPNGAGKSTALKTMARQIKPLSGSVLIDDVDIASMEPQQFARMLAYVPQLIEVPHRMSVHELVALGRNPHQQWWSWESSANDSKAVDFALAQTELTDLRKRLVTDLSGGERQRAVIAMALAQQTRFILLDEPTAHLDFRHQLQLLELLKQLRSIGFGVLLVLHDLNLTTRIADRVLLLAKVDSAQDAVSNRPSTIFSSGAPETVFDTQTLRRVYQVDVAIVRDTETNFVGYMPTRAL